MTTDVAAMTSEDAVLRRLDDIVARLDRIEHLVIAAEHRDTTRAGSAWVASLTQRRAADSEWRVAEEEHARSHHEPSPGA